jgi:membrane fusion protein, multidrug efflux system
MRPTGFIGAMVVAVSAIGAVPVGAQMASQSYPTGDPGLAVRAMVVSPTEAMLSAEISGRIISVTKRAGGTFRKDETMVSFDCALFQARVDVARAALSAARTMFDSTSRMFALKSVGQYDVDLAKTQVEKGSAELAIQEYDASNCRITAPFDGRVTEVKVNPHESVKAGDELIGVLDNRNLELEVLVPSTWLRWLRSGVGFSVTLDATGRAYRAEVDRLGATVDAASQSVQVFGRFLGKPKDVLSGMTGDVAFSPPEGGGQTSISGKP